MRTGSRKSTGISIRIIRHLELSFEAERPPPPHHVQQELLLAAGLSLLIALITVSFQSIRAATANPVDSLRYE